MITTGKSTVKPRYFLAFAFQKDHPYDNLVKNMIASYEYVVRNETT